MEVQSYKGDKHILLFVDDYSRMMTVMFLKQKSNAFQMFKWYLARVEKEIGKSLKCLRSDRGGEFTSREFEMFYNEIMKKESKDRLLHQGPLHRMEMKRK